jgi:hypothetical protein
MLFFALQRGGGELARGSTTRHPTLGLIALCAILLHALVPALVFVDRPGAIVCTETRDGGQNPANTGQHDHAACCILACAASGLATLAATYARVDFPPPLQRRVAFSRDRSSGASSSPRLNFEARGPPPTA